MKRLVYLSPVPWASFKQRPHKFVEWFHSKTGSDVLWVDPYPGRLPVSSDFRRFVHDVDKRKEFEQKVAIPSWLSVIRPRTMPVEPLPVLGKINRVLWKSVTYDIDAFVRRRDCTLVIGKPSEMAIQVLENHQSICSVYDAMDDFPEFHRGISQAAMRRRDRQIAERVTKIQVSSTRLADKYRNYGDKLSVVLNAYSLTDLPTVTGKRNRAEKTVIGYVGTISHWFDWELVVAMARAVPNAVVRLIGPNLAPAMQSLPGNIELLPACPHEDAIKAMQSFTVGLIPFKRSVLTDSVDPIKYYEYRAMGLPVLSTYFGEMSMRKDEKGVFYLEKSSDFAAIVDTAARFAYTVEEINSFRNANTWERRFNSSEINAFL